jgi:hypothetical protein
MKILVSSAFTFALSLTLLSSAAAGDREKARVRERPAREGDKANDGALDRKELRSAVDAELKELDRDKDGKIDHGERKSLQSLRSRLDKDGDGVIDRENLKKLRETHPEAHDRVMKRVREGGNRKGERSVSNDREQNRETYVDKREANQQKRIDHGVQKGYLTAEETQKLQGMEKAIAETEASFKSDGKLSKDEMKTLHDMLDQASVQIWAEKHDTEGNQMATYRFGKNVFAKDTFTSKIENSNMTGAEARALMKEFREASAAKRRLANDNLSVQERSDLFAKYDYFINQYFEVR